VISQLCNAYDDEQSFPYTLHIQSLCLVLTAHFISKNSYWFWVLADMGSIPNTSIAIFSNSLLPTTFYHK